MNKTSQSSSKSLINMPNKVSQIIQRFAKDTRKILKENVFEEYLFGSYATKDQTPLSDIDILIIVNTLNPEIRRQMSGLASDYSLQYGIYISPILKARKVWEKNKQYQTLFYTEITQYGIPL